MGAESAYAHNVVTGAGQSGPEDAITGGVPTAGNVCDDGTCRPFGSRRFYLTKNAVAGSSAGTRCDTGFHVAHLSEILDPSSLHYDADRGYQTFNGGGQGAPFLVPGWLYLLINHCSDYAGGGLGTSAQLATGAASDIPGTPWLVNSTDSCINTQRVWCVEG